MLQRMPVLQKILIQRLLKMLGKTPRAVFLIKSEMYGIICLNQEKVGSNNSTII